MLSDKTEQLVVKVSKQMHRQLCEEARITGTGLSELIRTALIEALAVAKKRRRAAKTLISAKAAQLQDDAKQAGVPVRDHCRMVLEGMTH